MNRFVTATALAAALALGSVATPSFAFGAHLVISTPQAPCGIIIVEGNNNVVNCNAQTGPAVEYDLESQYRPQRQRSAQVCVTPQGNYPLIYRLPLGITCWQPTQFGPVQGWTGMYDDNFFYDAY